MFQRYFDDICDDRHNLNVQLGSFESIFLAAAAGDAVLICGAGWVIIDRALSIVQRLIQKILRSTAQQIAV